MGVISALSFPLFKIESLTKVGETKRTSNTCQKEGFSFAITILIRYDLVFQFSFLNKLKDFPAISVVFLRFSSWQGKSKKGKYLLESLEIIYKIKYSLFCISTKVEKIFQKFCSTFVDQQPKCFQPPFPSRILRKTKCHFQSSIQEVILK